MRPPDIEIDAGGFDRERSYEWDAQVGFFTTWASPPWSIVRSQIGFFDRFTVTMNRQSQALAITAVEDFDDRYPQPPRSADLPPTRRPRLLPP